MQQGMGPGETEDDDCMRHSLTSLTPTRAHTHTHTHARTRTHNKQYHYIRAQNGNTV